MWTVTLTENGVTTIADSSGGQFVWFAVLGIILALYFALKQTRKRTERHYLDQRSRQQEHRRSDPDLKPEYREGRPK